MITVYFDGKCNLCNKEISYYKKICNKDKFQWFDIANHPKYLKGIKILQSEALLYLHATDENKKIYVGVEAFILIWKNLKYWNILAFFVSMPFINQVSKFFYKKFAKYRFNNLKHCMLSLEK